MRELLVFTTCFLLLAGAVSAEVVEYELVVTETTLAPAGKPRQVLAINGSIPGPVLRFREGDTARVTVRNQLKEESTSIHWHGLLLPNEMDGVPYVTTPPINPGKSHEFTFPLTHAGTYWYHSHTGLQEQRGMYGSIVVEPTAGELHAADRDYVVLLSDWTNEDPHEVMRTLMRGSDYYPVKKGSAQSIVGAYRAGALPEYWHREKSRMPPMDVSDVYYDAFLINGGNGQTLAAKPGETVRLRLINAGASTYFYVHSAAGPLTIVAADGPAVKPVEVERLFMGIAETYDVLVKVPEDGAWELRATPQDNSGHASIFLGEGKQRLAPDLPPPSLYSMDEMLEAGMASMDEEPAMPVNPERPTSPYPMLEALAPTTLPTSAPVREIELRLTGDMVRYIWSFNGKTFKEEPTIPVKAGEVLRVELVNDTMMHHPIHLHGHFFRLLNSHGELSPLKHTVDVPPMGRRTIEFLANEQGDWLFHCHLLYHMDAGMTRIFSYRQGEDPAYQPTLDPDHLGMTSFMLEGMVLPSMIMGHAHWMRGRETLGLNWHYDFDSHEEHEHGGQRLNLNTGQEHEHEWKQYEVDLFWDHYFGPNFSTRVGYRLSNEEGTGNRAFGELSYRLPYMFTSSIAIDTRGDARLGLAKELQITPRLSVSGKAEYDTNTEFEWAMYVHYMLSKEFSLTSGYNSDHGWDAGLSFRF
jgi:FtsP/CotA-like multicopper oxidase with cupredoxin domain